MAIFEGFFREKGVDIIAGGGGRGGGVAPEYLVQSEHGLFLPEECLSENS